MRHIISSAALVALAMACSSGTNSGSSGTQNSGSGGSSSGGSGGTSATGTGGGGSAGDTSSDLPTQVNACTEGLDESTIEANLELVGSFDNSIHELVACGGLTIRVVGTLVQGIIEMLVSNEDDITPDGLMFEGEGTYRAGGDDPNQDTDMLIRFYDTESGSPELIEHDVFAAETYLVGARAEATLEVDENNPLNSVAYVDISFDAVGPMVHLLGFGAEPPNPLRLKANDVDNLSPELDEVIIETRVTVVDERGDSQVSYDVETGPDPVLNMFDSSKVDYRIVSVEGQNSVVGQSLLLTDDGWQIEFAGGNRLNGSIDFSVTGGDFDYNGLFEYDAEAYADISLSCSD